jgi:LysR family transcriptional regulator, glycine cleavage system transcriptional activator
MTVRLPPLNSLRAFEAAARLLSFKKAADELAVTPAAVSHQIKLLEAFLDLRLFHRLTRALTLTDEGAAMLPRVQEGFASLVGAIEATRHKETGGNVTVCAPPSFAARWLVPRLDAFSRAHPEINIRLSSSVATIDKPSNSANAQSAAVTEPMYDLMIRFGRGHYPGNTVDRLFSPAYVTVCSPSLLTGPLPLKKPRDLLGHNLIHDTTAPELDDRPGWAQWLNLAGIFDIENQIRGSYFEDAALAMAAAVAGQGVALAARPLVSADIAEGRLVTPFPHAIPSVYAYYVTTPATRAERPTMLTLRNWLVQEAARERAMEAGEQNMKND